MSNEVGHENAPASPASILGYYFRVGRGKRILNEAKLIVVGRGGVGKTCLIKRLIRDTFDKSEPETSGVEIQVWPVELPNDAKIRLHIWDFGGQEILHATHQLFLTERTLYLLVLSGREGNSTQDAEYWLQLIRSFGGTSRVVIALNKYVEHPFDVNRGLLVEKYPSVAEFVETDCADPAMGLLELKRVIFQHVGNSELCRVDFPLEWFAIKERLAEMTSHGENFLTWTRFQEICGQLGEGDPEQQQQLAKYLHVLGIALNYRDEPRLRDHHVLNPNWVTTGIYTLLRTGQKRSGDLRSNSSNRKRINPSAVPKESRQIGVLTAADLATSLDSRRYPSTCHEFLLQLMEKFQLCFRLPGVEKRYLVPELLSANQPDIALLLEEPCLRFQYQYEILPEGLLPRFIVQTHIYSETTSHLRWRTGVVLEREGCSAVVRTDDRERRVDIYVTGLETRRRELLAIARASFEEQHFDLKGLIVAERVPIPGMLSATVSYRKLLSLEDRGETHYEPENLDTPVRVSRLLGGIESPKSRKRRQRVTMRPIKVRPIHISKVKGKVHVAIITVRPDEYDAVESRLGDSLPVEGGNNSYEHAFVNQETGDDIRVVLTRCVGQGNTAAQGVANNIVQDIDPSWILLVGIAGGVADHEYSLGDVILASSLHDFSFGAALEGSSRTYQATGGYMHQDVIRFLQTRIVGKNRDRLLNLAGFTTDENFMRHPPLFPFNEDHGNAFYGERDFRIQVAKKLESRFPAGLRKGGPLVWPGPCANGNLLVKDSKLLKEWQSTARQVVAMETELAGVYECARSAGRQNYPLLAIRGLSDIVGLRRNADWTEYACNTAAALACAVLRSGLIDFSTNLPKSWNKHSEDDSNG